MATPLVQQGLLGRRETTRRPTPIRRAQWSRFLAYWLQPPLTLTLGKERLSFHTTSDFEFALAGRTAIPAAKFGELLHLPVPELLREAEMIRLVERRFVEAIELCIAEPGSISTILSDLGANVFSNDHRWRHIVTELNNRGADFDEYKKLVLVKYLQYLTARQQLLMMIYDASVKESVDLDDEFGTLPPELQGIGTKDTVIFDLMQIQPSHRFVNAYQRLPRGETVNVHIPPGSSIDVLFSKHKFQLLSGEQFALVDDTGHVYKLTQTKTIIGRGTDADVRLKASYRSVSRHQLLVEIQPDKTLQVTDLSSHGTFFPPQYVI